MLTAFVAACEVMSRIGVAAGNSLERRGFHAPGLTGTFGGAVAAGRLMKLNQAKMVNALGIAGSYSGGLIEFSRCQEGAMIKRLHLGKAAEGGVTAAILAEQRLRRTGKHPRGEVRFLPDVFRFAQTRLSHPSAGARIRDHEYRASSAAPVISTRTRRSKRWRSCAANFSFNPEDIREITVGGIEKLVTHHAIYKPKDLMMAQYSIPFCVALGLYFDPTDPESFDERKLKDKKILAMMRKVRLEGRSRDRREGLGPRRAASRSL